MTTTRRSLFRRKAIIAPLVAGALLLSACSGSTGGDSAGGETPESDREYNVVFIAGVTGALQANTEAQVAGMQAAVDTLNENGGLNGATVNLTVLDDKSDPTVSVTLLQQYLAENDDPELVIPGLTSNQALGLVPILTREKILGIAAVQNPTLDDPEQYPYFFSNSIKSDVTSEAVAAYLKDQGVSKVALVAPNDALLQALQPSLEAAFGDADITMTVHAFDPEAIDTSAAFAEAEASGAEWIYADAVGAAVPRLLDGRLKAGAEDVPTIGGSSISAGSFLTVTTEAQRENLYPVLLPMTAYIPPEDRSDALNALIEKIGDPSALPLPLNNYTYGWDDIAIWAAGVEQAGTTDTVEVSEALQSLKLSGKNAPDRPWIIWDTLWSPETHFAQGQPEELTIATVQSEPKDGMIVPNP